MKKILTTLSLAAVVGLNAGVLATIDNHKITQKDVNMLMQGPMGGMTYDKMPVDAKKQVLDKVIENKLLVLNAKKSGIDKDKKFKEKLEQIKEGLMLNLWMDKEFQKVKIPDGEAKKYYDKNSDKFTKQAKIKASHILVKEEKTAKEIIAKLKDLKDKKLEDEFVKLAKEKSTGPSASKGGDLGFFSAKQMVPEFSKAAFALKKGEITKAPVKTKFGYHIILKLDEKKAEKIAFKDVEKNILNGLKMEKFKSIITKKITSLRKKAKIVIKDKSLEAKKEDKKSDSNKTK